LGLKTIAHVVFCSFPTNFWIRAMKLCCFDDNRLGLISPDGSLVVDVSSVLHDLPNPIWPRAKSDALIENLERLRPRIEERARSGAWKPLADVSLHSPIACPSKLIAAPVNYRAHIDEANADKGINFGTKIKSIEEYGLFLKASSSIVGPSEGIQLPSKTKRVDHEIELVAIIGKEGRHISRSEAGSYVAAYSIGLDMTVRGAEDRSWRKSYDSFAVIGPWLVTADEIANPGGLDLELRVNGQVRQAANTRSLIFDILRLVEYASSVYTLYPGDVIMTGTPEGVGPIQTGDVMDCSIEKIGTMRVLVN
jgi:2-keto-4-pentenoate hydratase/2-oxohepta-3-ene-1,7-dioic acid hydratase in catechol pathway